MHCYLFKNLKIKLCIIINNIVKMNKNINKIK